MKKEFVLTVAVILAVSMFAGCSKNSSQPQTPDTNSTNSSSEPVNNDNENFVESKGYFGKIKSIVGNEIEIDIGELAAPELEETDEDLGDLGPMGQMIAVPQEGTEGSGTIDPSASAPKLDLIYTGESKSFTIPAGASIFKFASEETLSALKVGSVVSISVEGANDTVVRVEIWE